MEEDYLIVSLIEGIDTLQMEQILEFKLLYPLKKLLPGEKKKYE